VLRLAAPETVHGDLHEDLHGEFAGAGTFFDGTIERLTALAASVRRRDQTLSHFGFAEEELRSLARALNGRGIDRMVPVGQALAFDRRWDGYDLFQELTRQISVTA
jgi:folate-dependent tRNA-U54 methylase TrmFO/GidA